MADHLGRLGGVWREADCEATDLETLIQDLLAGEYSDPIRVVAFNTAEGWSQDVSEDVVEDLRSRCALQLRDVPSDIESVVDSHEGTDGRQLRVRLV